MPTENNRNAEVVNSPANSEEILLDIQNITKKYGDVDALRGVSLSVRKGEFLTLLGPSGSGKTTLLKIIAGAINVTSGALLLDGKNITDLPSRFRGIGMVFQNFALMPHLNVFENVAFPLRIRNVQKSEVVERVRSALEVVQLPSFEDRRPRELSGGQQQRVAIARALVYHPPLILMDEPLGALDRKLREQMQLEIRRLHNSLNLTMIYVTHDQEEALTMSDRICVMGNGQIQEVGAPSELYTRPKTRFVADFLGAANIFSGVVAEQDATTMAIDADGFGRVRCPANKDFGVGDAVSWTVRPENIKVTTPDAGDASATSDNNSFPATVKEKILAGQLTKYIVEAAGRHTVMAACLTDSFAQDFFEGEPVRIEWSSSAAVALTDSLS
jgi:putative spermidine/putrescine transport system ATP-binding protein